MYVKVASYQESATSTQVNWSQNQVIHISLQSNVISSVRSKSHMSINTNITSGIACTHINISLKATKVEAHPSIGPQFRSVKVSCWDVWLRSISTTHKYFRQNTLFSTSTPNQQVTFQNQKQSSHTYYSETEHNTIDANYFSV